MYNRILIQGIGVNDSPILTTREDGTRDLIYMKWKGMINRVYSKAELNKHPCYRDVTVSEYFLTFSNFRDWFVKQVGYDEEGFDLDKDLLVKGNKVYCPKACLLLPKEINKFMINRFRKDTSEDSLPVGVHVYKRSGKYQAQTGGPSKRKFLGRFDTPEEAFYVYKHAKEQQAKDLAEKWKGSIDARAYNALLNYTVNIED